jgi:hypothetical protein
LKFLMADLRQRFRAPRRAVPTVEDRKAGALTPTV